MIRRPLTIPAMMASTTAAFAHSKSVDTTPADAFTVGAVVMIDLRFASPMRVTPDADLADGDDTVGWRYLSANGHLMQRSFTFSVAPGPAR